MKIKSHMLAGGCSLMLLGAPVFADDAEDRAEDLAEAQEQIEAAAQVLAQMKSETDMASFLSDAKAVFIVPEYAAAALLAGGAGGEGVLLLRQDDDSWANPAFYNIGQISAGLQAGVEVGSIGMLLMNDEAVASFGQDNNFAVDAEAGLAIVDWEARAEVEAGRGDVLIWSDTEGLFGELSVGLSDVMFDDDETHAYYDQEVSAQAVVAGDVENPRAQELSEFAAFEK